VALATEQPPAATTHTLVAFLNFSYFFALLHLSLFKIVVSVAFIVFWMALSPACYALCVVLGKNAVRRWPSCARQ